METYKWATPEYHHTNENTMRDYLDNHLSQDELAVIFEDGSYAEIQNNHNGFVYGVMASGDGDSFNHKVEFDFIH